MKLKIKRLWRSIQHPFRGCHPFEVVMEKTDISENEYGCGYETIHTTCMVCGAQRKYFESFCPHTRMKKGQIYKYMYENEVCFLTSKEHKTN